MAVCPGVLLDGGDLVVAGRLLFRINLLCSAILISADGGELGVAGRISSHRRRRLLSWAGFSQA